MFSNDSVICPKKTTRVLIEYNNAAGPFTTFQGLATAQKRIDDAVGVQLLSATIKTGTTATNTGGFLFAVQSRKLGSLVGSNPYQVTATTNTPNGTFVAISDMIGFGDLAQDGFTTNFKAENMNLNKYLSFASPAPIESFDWSVQPFTGTWTFGAAYTIELLFEFRHQCECL